MVLRHTFIPAPGLVYFLTKRPDGEVPVTISLRDDDMKHLVNDPLFLLYGTNRIGVSVSMDTSLQCIIFL